MILNKNIRQQFALDISLRLHSTIFSSSHEKFIVLNRTSYCAL